jgi:RNA polymerase primary sigma factor
MMLQCCDAIYDRYIRDVARFSRIQPQREMELSTVILRSRNSRRVQAAVDELVQSNLLLVVHCLKDFAQYLDSPGVRLTPMDLISEGNIGLVKAARLFDAGGCGRAAGRDARRPARPRVRFSTYACRSIKNAMRRAVKLSRFIHIPEHHFGYWSRINALRLEGGAALTDAAMEKSLGVGSAKLKMLKHGQASCMELLDDMGTAGGEPSRWSETMEDTTAVSPLAATEGNDLCAYLVAEVERLPERTRRMLLMMYVEGKAETFSDLAREFGVSKERCRQVCSRGLAVLRRRLQPELRKVIGVADARGTERSAAAEATPKPARAPLHIVGLPALAKAFGLRGRTLRQLQTHAA